MDYIKILKAIARMNLNDENKIIIDHFVNNNGMDSYVMNKITIHKLQYLFYRHLNELHLLEQINKYDSKSLISQFIFWQLRYVEYLNIIKLLINNFDENKINYSLIKGVTLVDSLYNDDPVVYRDFGDIDILIEKGNVGIVNKVLCEQGFNQGFFDEKNNLIKAPRNKIIYWSLNSHQEHEYIKKSVYSLYSSKILNCIDINTTIFEGGKIEIPISTSKILENKFDKKLSSGINIKCLNHTYAFLQLCYHFYKDTVYEVKRTEREDYCLIKFCDIREYILKFRKEIDWDEFIFIINHYDLGKQIYYTLFLVSSFYDDLEIDNVMVKIAANQTISFPNWGEILL